MMDKDIRETEPAESSLDVNRSGDLSQAFLTNCPHVPPASPVNHLEEAVPHLSKFLHFLGFSFDVLRWRLLLPCVMAVCLIIAPPMLLVLFRSNNKNYFPIEVPMFICQALFAISALASSYIRRPIQLIEILISSKHPLIDDKIHMALEGEFVKKGFFKRLLWPMATTFLLYGVREGLLLLCYPENIRLVFVIVRLCMTLSWTYMTAIVMSFFELFRVACSLQHGFLVRLRQTLQEGPDHIWIENDVQVRDFVEAHMEVEENISTISRNLQVSLVCYFLVGTVGQFMTLTFITHWGQNFMILEGVFIVMFCIQAVGIACCITAARNIANEGENILLEASKFHSLQTCPSHLPASSMTTFQARESLIKYLEIHQCHVTVFGTPIDRSLVDTVQSRVFSIFLFVLGIVLGSTKSSNLKTFQGQVAFFPCSSNHTLLPH